MAARNHQSDVRESSAGNGLALLPLDRVVEQNRVDVALEMVDSDQGLAQ